MIVVASTVLVNADNRAAIEAVKAITALSIATPEMQIYGADEIQPAELMAQASNG